MSGPSWLDIREASQRARCGEKSIRRAVKLGEIEHCSVPCQGGHRLVFAEPWIDAWVLSRRRSPATTPTKRTEAA